MFGSCKCLPPAASNSKIVAKIIGRSCLPVAASRLEFSEPNRLNDRQSKRLDSTGGTVHSKAIQSRASLGALVGIVPIIPYVVGVSLLSASAAVTNFRTRVPNIGSNDHRTECDKQDVRLKSCALSSPVLLLGQSIHHILSSAFVDACPNR